MDRWICLLHIASLLLIKYNCQEVIPRNPLTEMSLVDRIKQYGYPVELHSITTQDGYILSLYRVPGTARNHENATNSSDTLKKSAVLLLHGMGGSPGNYFVLGHDSLALYLAKKGFDVWTLCSRGVQCSHKIKHKYMDWDNQNYWKFTLQEMAIYDLPPTIDYILEKSNQSQLFMVGHSAGNTMQYILLSERPEFNKKIKISTALGPTVFIGLSDYPLLKVVSSLVKVGKGIFFKLLGNYESIPKAAAEMLRDMAKDACHDKVFAKACIKFSSLVGSHSSQLVDYEKIFPLIVADASYRIPAMMAFQYAEIVNSGNFTKYDYGKNNMKMYGQKTPPSYNLTKVTCPTALFYAQHDSIAPVQSVKKLKKYLPNLILEYMVPYKKFTHIDFIFAHNASKLVYQEVAKMFEDYDNRGDFKKKIII